MMMILWMAVAVVMRRDLMMVTMAMSSTTR